MSERRESDTEPLVCAHIRRKELQAEATVVVTFTALGEAITQEICSYCCGFLQVELRNMRGGAK